MEKQTARLEAFSDGIFGVAITLLAVEIGVDQYSGATNLNLWEKIVGNWPEYFTYFNSFATVLLMWMGHQQIMSHLRKSNHWLILINGMLLMLIAFFPYPTRLVGTFIGTDAQETAVAFYAGFTGSISLTMYFLNLCIVKNKHLLLSPERSLPSFKSMMKAQLIGFLIYEGSAALAMFYPGISLIITFFIWILWIFVSRDLKEEEDLSAADNNV